MIILNIRECQKIKDHLAILLEQYRKELNKFLDDYPDGKDETLQKFIERNQKLEMRLAKMQTGIAWRRALEQQKEAKNTQLIKDFISLEAYDLWTGP